MFNDKSKQQKDALSTVSETKELSLMEKSQLYNENETEEDYQLDSPLSYPIFQLSLLQSNSEDVMNRESGELDLKPGWYGSQDDSFLNPLRESITGEVLFFTLTQARYDGEYVKGEFPICSASDGQRGDGDPGGLCRSCPYHRNECKGGLRLILNLHLDDYEQREYGFDRYPIVVRFASKGIKPFKSLLRDVRLKYKKPVARVAIQITSEKVEDQKGRKFYVPVFTPVDIADNESWSTVKAAKVEVMQNLVPEIAKITLELDESDTINALSGYTGDNDNDYIRNDESASFNYGENAEQPL